MTSIIDALDFWPLNTAWYAPAMAGVCVILVVLYLLPGFLRSRALRRTHSVRLSSNEVRKLRGDGH